MEAPVIGDSPCQAFADGLLVSEAPSVSGALRIERLVDHEGHIERRARLN